MAEPTRPARLILVLLAVAGLTGLILGGVERLTREPIRATERAAKEEALRAVLPGARAFEPLPLPKGYALDEVLRAVAGGKTVGYAYLASPKGYGGPIRLVVGIRPDGRVEAVRILSLNETPGLGTKATEPAFIGQYAGKAARPFRVVKNPPQAPEEIQAISGATISSRAVTSGVDEAVRCFVAVHAKEASR